MKKSIVILFVLICNSIFSQTMNKTFYDEKSKKNCLIGYCDRSVFNDTAFCAWFDAEYISFSPNAGDLSLLSDKILPDLKITIVMATWCGDSRREVPRFLKILDNVKFPSRNLEIINVDRKKEAEGTNVKDMKIELVPTIIFYLNGKELGRIIETPKESLEKDFVKILTSQN